MLRTPLLLFLTVFDGITAWDHFQFDITFFCYFTDRNSYNLKIEWFENDSFLSGNDRISSAKIFTPNTGRSSFTMDGAMNGDEILSNGYQPRALISHDCTDDKKRADLVLTVTTLCQPASTCHYRIIQDLTNNSGWKDIQGNGLKQGDLSPFPDYP